MQDVRAPALGERAPLPDAEPVLLVHDDDREVAEHTSFWISACVPTTRSASPEAMSCRTFACCAGAEGAREQLDPDAETGAELVDRQEVLLRERLRRRHQRRLPPCSTARRSA